MKLPEPVPGLVIRYSYLWEREAQRGEEEGRKDRPCAVVLTAKQEPDGKTRVMVAPVTHTMPEKGAGAVEVPPKIGQALGFDAAKSWIVTAEVNTFTWPGPDIRKAKGDEYAFGQLPFKLAKQVRHGVLEQNREQLKTVERDEKPPSRADMWVEFANRREADSTPPVPTRDLDRDRER